MLGLEALDDELGDGFNGFAVEGVFDDAHAYLQRHSGFSVSGGRGVYVGKDKGFGAVAAEGGFVLAPFDGHRKGSPGVVWDGGTQGRGDSCGDNR